MSARITWIVLGAALVLIPSGIAENDAELFREYRQKGIDQVKAQDLPAAEVSFRTALTYQPDDPDCTKVLGLITEELNKRAWEELELEMAVGPPRNHAVRIMAIAEYFTWTEHYNGEKNTPESGPLFGLEINGDYTENQLTWFRYHAKIFGGSVDFDGDLPDQTPYKSDMEYLGGEVGFDADLVTLAKTEQGDVLNLFFGLGYRIWERELSGNAGYRETWQTLYCTTGLWGRYGLSASNQSQLFGKLEVRLPVYNNQSISISGLPDLTPGWGPSFYGSIGVDLSRISFEAYVQALYFSESDEEFEGVDPGGDDIYIFQPESLGLSVGLKVGVVF